ncbi:MAG: TRAM domain-containing protein [Candidatus Saccharibacteria bacterium]
MIYILIFNSVLLVMILIATLSSDKSKKLISSNKSSSMPLIMDSSGLIDGRIIELAKSGFIQYDISVPEFIVNELQLISDGHDAHKRERGRYGLDIIAELQNIPRVKVIIDRNKFDSIKATDDKLIALSKLLKGVLYTTDFNLSKVAAVEGISVMNVNELAQQLRPISLPGEKIAVKIIQKGSGQSQGVGYLDDGTMIVVDGAAKFIGKKIDVTVDRMHQSVAGKMVFGKLSK